MCHDECSGEAGGCEVARQWTQPARSAAETCFAAGTAKWRGRGSGAEDPFGPSVLDPALAQLQATVQSKADALRDAWQYANSVNPARTLTANRIREVSRWGPFRDGDRYGGYCYGIAGPQKFGDYVTMGTLAVEARTSDYKRCGSFTGPPQWLEVNRFNKEIAREARNLCWF